MNFVADESVDQPIVDRLRRDGHQVWSVAEMNPGISDDVVLDLANREGALLLTADRDFGELVFRQRLITSGVILIRLAGLSEIKKTETLAFAINKHGDELQQLFTVISPGIIRFRQIKK